MSSDIHYLKKELYELVQKDSTIFEFLQSGSLDGVWYWDLENPENEWMSPHFWITLGYNPDNKRHLASEWQNLINSDDLQVAISNFEAHCSDPNHPYDQIVRYRHKDGSTVWVRCRGVAIRDKAGKPIRMLGAHTDITPQKKAEESLLENKEYLSTLFNSTLNGIMVIDAENHIITDVNQTAVEIIGLSQEKIIGQECHHFICSAERGKCPISDLGQTIDESERQLFSSYGTKSVIKTVKPISFNGKAYYIESFIDISDRKKTESALSESELKYRNLFESSIDALFLIDVNTGKIVDCNESALKLHQIENREKFIGLTLYEISPEFQPNGLSSKKLSMDFIKKAYQEGSAEFEWIHLKRDETEFPVLVTLSGMNIGSEAVVLAVNRDLTEIKYAAAKREKLITELQEALETLQRYERIISSTPDFISLVDKQYVYRLVNDAYLKTFNKKREDILNKSLPDLLGQDFFEKNSKPNLDRAFRGETVTVEQTLSIPGKSNIHLAMTYHPVKNKDGAIDYVSLDARDITELKSFSDRLDLATDVGGIGIWEWNLSTNELIWDDTMLELYKVQPGEFSEAYDAWRSRVHPEDLELAEEGLAKAIEKTTDFASEFRIIWPDGQIRHIKAAASVSMNEKGKAIRMIGVNSDITQNRELELELRMLATTDPLTGAHNRRYFMDRAKEEFDRSKRYEIPMTALMIDIDHFKTINDNHGHSVGDEVLKNLVSDCIEELRGTDLFGRIGGEEFSVILPQTDVDRGWTIADRLRKRLSQSIIEADGNQIKYTISAGLVAIQPDDNTIEDILKRADLALYSAKNNGRNRVEKG
jgi:diguanylate cyclase (GGDEF)-like protein/PAS domain S-box-containing protein